MLTVCCKDILNDYRVASMANRISQVVKAIALPLSFMLFFIFIQQVSFGQTTISSSQSGLWDLTSSWQGGTIPGVDDNVIVDHEITIQAGTTVEVNDLLIDQSGILIIDGTLILNGDLTMVNNDPEFIAGSDATVIIRGNANISNKVSLNLSSYFIVVGDFTISGGGSTDIDITDASMYVFGTFDGGSTNLDICTDYDNNTEDYNPDSCHIGTEEAFYTNEEDSIIPVDIIDLVDTCDVSAAISNNNGPVCPQNDVVFTLSGTSNSTVFYSINGGTQSSTVLTDGTATITITSALETQILSLDSVVIGSCNQDLAGIRDTVFVVDTTPPTITNCPTDYLVDSQDSICGAQINYTIPSGADDCSVVSVTLLEGLTSGDTFPTGLTTVSYEIADASGNADTCSFTVLVTDIDPPKIRSNTTDTITVNNTPGECGKIVVFTAPTAYDNCGGVVITRTSVDGSGAFFPIGITPVTYEAKDLSDNVISDTIFVKVIDAEPPVIDTCPEVVYSTIFDTTVNIVNHLSLNVYDNCPGAFLTSIPETVDFSLAGTTSFQSIATDLYGNTDTCSFDVIVQENSPIEKDPEVDTVCQGTTVSYYFNGSWPSKSKWSVGGPDATISDQDSQTTEITFNAAGVYTIKAKIQDTGRPTFYTDFMVVVDGDPSLVADVSISASPSNTVCAGDEVTFTAVPTNGGDAPTYQWQIDGTDIPGETESTFISSTLSDSQEISCVMTSSILCVTNNPAISDTITMAVNPLPAASISLNNGPVCEGDDAEFTVSGTAGAILTYNLNGATNITLTLSGGEEIITVNSAIEDQTLNLVSVTDGTCTQTLNETSTVVVNPLPATGEIIPD